MQIGSGIAAGRVRALGLLCLVLCVLSCDGQHRTAVGTSHTAASASAAAEAKPGAAKGPGTPTVNHTLMDTGWGLPYSTVKLPAGWGFNGAVLHGGDSCSVMGDTPMWSAESADKAYGVAMLPALKTGFSSDPNLMRQMQAYHCPALRSTSALAFLTEYVLPHVHGNNVHIVSTGPEPQLDATAAQFRQMQAQFEQIGNQSQYSRMHGTVETARVLLQYQENGRTMNEMASTLFTCTDTMMMMPMTGRTELLDCSAPLTMIVHAPDDGTPFNNETIQAHSKDPAFFTITQNPAWTERLNQKLAAQRQQMQQNQQQQFAANQQRLRDQQQQFAQHNAAVAAQQHARDEAQQGFVHYLSGTNTYTNPETGQQYELSNQYNHTYVNQNGNVSLQTDSATSPGVDWTLLQPKY